MCLDAYAEQGDTVLWWFWGEDADVCLSSCVEGTKIPDRL